MEKQTEGAAKANCDFRAPLAIREGEQVSTISQEPIRENSLVNDHTSPTLIKK